MSTCTAPINIDTKLTTPDSNMIVFNYYEGDCATKKDNDGILIKYRDSDQTNNIVYKGYTYVLGSINGGSVCVHPDFYSHKKYQFWEIIERCSKQSIQVSIS